jgi:hypothetical protein
VAALGTWDEPGEMTRADEALGRLVDAGADSGFQVAVLLEGLETL